MQFDLRLFDLCRKRYCVMLMLSLLVALPGVVWAHAQPEQMAPAPNATLQQAPDAVTIRFSKVLEPAFSSLKVTDQQGHTVNQGQSYVHDDKPGLLVAPLKELEPGVYVVNWHVVSRDGHRVTGEYTFQVR